MRKADKVPEENRKPATNERIPGQGNSSDGLTRRIGADIENRGKKEQERLSDKNINHEEHRLREGSQGGSKSQQG